MKKNILTILSLIFCVTIFAQTVPQGINYQAVARDTSGNVLTNQSFTVQLSVIEVSPAGSISWQETHGVNTNEYGLFTLIIGQGVNTGIGSSAMFDSVGWGTSKHYIKVELNDGNGFIDMGTTEFMSVPYALQSANSGPQGPIGLTGATGPQGPIGLTGATGPQGVQGSSANSLWSDNGMILTPNTSTPDISIAGNLGIGTTNPIRGKLDIVGSVPCCGTTQGDFWYYLYNVPNGQFQYYNGTSNFDISVYADGRFMGSGIHIFSDERIKDVVGLTNNSEDLSTILSLEITDYQMKDKSKGGNLYKKVIAQQVMDVYPQAVSLTTEVVPDIYSVATIEGGYISLETDLVIGDKVRLIFEDKTELYDVLEVNKNGFRVSEDADGKVFVYGRQVDDFHSVDYESISMLNVSATQELYKLILNQKEIIESLQKEIVQLEEVKEDINTIKNLLGIPSDSTSTMKK
jgi:hypothetical protein